jgi:phosphoglycerate dehydrogenase-like enzyme
VREPGRDGDRPVVTVLCAGHRPPGMGAIESAADVRYTDAAGLSGELKGADALFVWDFLSDAVPGAWPSANRLSWLHIASAGVDKVLAGPVPDSAVPLTNSRGVFEDPIAEYVLGALLAFVKDLPVSLANQREHRWQHRETERLAGRTALVVGTGPIGRATARLLRAVGVRVSGAGRRERSGDPDFGTVHATDGLNAVLGGFDFVIALAPLTEQTNGMFDAAAFAAMRPTARFVNAGRGALVVTADLVAALRAGELAGAALDVFEQEPLDRDSPLWDLPNVLVTPHMSGDFAGWHQALVDVFTDNFHRWRAGAPLRNVVDKRLGYVPSDPGSPLEGT